MKGRRMEEVKGISGCSLYDAESLKNYRLPFSFAFVDVSCKKLLWPSSKRVLPVFFSRILMESCLTLSSSGFLTVLLFFESEEKGQKHLELPPTSTPALETLIPLATCPPLSIWHPLCLWFPSPICFPEGFWWLLHPGRGVNCRLYVS